MTRYVTDASRATLLQALSPELLDALLALVDERVAAALAECENGSGSEWVSLAEASDILRVSPSTIARRVKRGDLRTACVGRRRLIWREDLVRAPLR